MADSSENPVLVRIDGEDAGRFENLTQARQRAARDAWAYDTEATIDFVDEVSKVVLGRWSKQDYPQEKTSATSVDPYGHDPAATIEAGIRRGDLRPGTDGRLEVADNVLASTIYTCTLLDGCVLVAGHDGACTPTRTVPAHVPNQFDAAAAVTAIALSDAAQAKIRSAKAANTLTAYRRDWEKWADWCTRSRLIPLPASPNAVANYLTEADALLRPSGRPAYAPATLTRWVSSINAMHRAAGHPAPGESQTVRDVLSAIRRGRSKPPRRMRALTLDPLRTVLSAINTDGWPTGVAGRRDYALLLIGMAGAFRRSELVGHTTDLVTWVPDQGGITIGLPQSKGDQEARGLTKFIPFGVNPSTCGPCAYARWLQVLDAARSNPERPRPAIMRVALTEIGEDHICQGSRPLPNWVCADGPAIPVFVPINRHGDITLDRAMSGQAVYDVVRRRLEAADIPAAGWGAHSLRAGFVTQALRAGATYTAIMNQTGHKNPETVEAYEREHAPSQNNAVKRLGL